MFSEKAAYFEKKYENFKAIKPAFSFCSALYLDYLFGGNENGLSRAIQICSSAAVDNTASFELYLLNIFFEIENENFSGAKKLLGVLKKSRNFLKSFTIKEYAAFIFLEGLFDVRSGKMRSAEKKLSELKEYGSQVPSVFVTDLSGCLAVELNKTEEALDLLYSAVEKKSRSLGFFISLYNFFSNTSTIVNERNSRTRIRENKNLKLFSMLLNWGLTHGINLSVIAQEHSSLLENDELLWLYGGKLYSEYRVTWILKDICRIFMDREMFDKEALYYYKEADLKQVEPADLYYYLVGAAFKNRDERLSRYAIEQYLRSESGDAGLRTFCYSLMIENPSFDTLLRNNYQDIVIFCKNSLAQAKSRAGGRYYNSLLKFIIDCGEQEFSESIIDTAYSDLFGELFRFDAKVNVDKEVKICVYEENLITAGMYDVLDGKCAVEASDAGFMYFIIDGNKNILQKKAVFSRRVVSPDLSVYKRMFDKGFRSPELAAALGKEINGLENFSEENLGYLRAVISEKNISPKLRIQTNVTIGNILAETGDYDKAVGYYDEADENILQDFAIEQMLLAYINSRRYDSAVKLIIKKAECISDRNLFYCLKKIFNEKAYDGEVAYLAYELILKNWYDKSFLNVILKNYSGSLDEWHELSEALANMSVFDKALDEIIIKKTIWMHAFDERVQRIFERMYEMNPENSLISEFADYLAFEIIVNGEKVSMKVMAILEELFAATKESKFGVALCHLYIGHGLNSQRMDEVIKSAIDTAEKTDILPPVLKSIKDKKYFSPYIEKNQPFMLRTMPSRGKSVKLYYKFDEESEFKSKDMKYFGYGIFIVNVAIFYGEKITFYFSEELSSGSVTTKVSEIENLRITIIEKTSDLFFTINNALAYEQMFKYDTVENMITERLDEKPRTMSWLM